MTYRTKNKARQEQYDIMMRMAHDKTSNLYNSDGSQRIGALHRDHFWRGFNYGDRVRPSVNMYIAFPCWKAGVDFAEEAK